MLLHFSKGQPATAINILLSLRIHPFAPPIIPEYSSRDMNKPDPQTAGIDLGTTYSLVGHVSEAGKAELSPDRHVTDNFRTPSIVHIGADG